MALIPYNHPGATPSLSPRTAFSIASSSKPASSTHSRPSSYTIRPHPTATHSRHHRRPSAYSASSSSSSSSASNSHNGSSSSSSAGSSISSYTSISTRTFGTCSRPGYAPGQAPHDYFYNEEVREEWDCAPLDGKGRRVRRVAGGGMESGSGSGSGWSGSCDDDAPFSSSFFGGRRGRGGFEGRRDLAFSGSEASGSGSGSLRYVDDDARGGEESWENDSISPLDSISQVSTSSSARRSGFERDGYPQSRYSAGRSCGMEDGMRDLEMIPGGGSRISRSSRSGGGMVSMANGRFVRVEAPGWA